jgi:hypothetical protein
MQRMDADPAPWVVGRSCLLDRVYSHKRVPACSTVTCMLPVTHFRHPEHSTDLSSLQPG